MKIFAERLREVRTQRGETRKELAEVLGWSVSQISEMENDRKGTTIEKLAILCRHLKVSADYLLGLSDDK